MAGHHLHPSGRAEPVVPHLHRDAHAYEERQSPQKVSEWRSVTVRLTTHGDELGADLRQGKITRKHDHIKNSFYSLMK
jgi:hypothetical protein